MPEGKKMGGGAVVIDGDICPPPVGIGLKFIYSEKATKILRNLPLTFDE